MSQEPAHFLNLIFSKSIFLQNYVHDYGKKRCEGWNENTYESLYKHRNYQNKKSQEN